MVFYLFVVSLINSYKIRYIIYLKSLLLLVRTCVSNIYMSLFFHFFSFSSFFLKNLYLFFNRQKKGKR